MRKINLAIGLVVFISFLMSVYFYDQLPEEMATHWNAKGEVDGYSSKFFGAFIFPIIIAFVGLIFIVIPIIDPLKKNILKFKKYYFGMVLIFLLFLFMVHLQVILLNIGVSFSFNFVFPIGIAVIFFYVGVLCKNSKRNWFVGVRNPWTMSSDVVWERTNKKAGLLFQIAGGLMLVGALFMVHLFSYFIGFVIFIVIFSYVYSYMVYKKVNKTVNKGKKKK